MYIVTGSTGLIGFSTSEYFLKKGIKVLGIDNDMRSYFFGKKSSNKWKEKELKKNKLYSHYTTDIRDRIKIINIFKRYKKKIKAIIHTAAQPSHDWAIKEPMTDFDIKNLTAFIKKREAVDLKIKCKKALSPKERQFMLEQHIGADGYIYMTKMMRPAPIKNPKETARLEALLKEYDNEH